MSQSLTRDGRTRVQVPDAWWLLTKSIDNLLGRDTRDCLDAIIEVEFENLHLALGALPLPLDAYSVLQNRLTAAYTYWKIGESGAMKWELRQIARATKLKTFGAKELGK